MGCHNETGNRRDPIGGREPTGLGPISTGFSKKLQRTYLALLATVSLLEHIYLCRNPDSTLLKTQRSDSRPSPTMSARSNATQIAPQHSRKSFHKRAHPLKLPHPHIMRWYLIYLRIPTLNHSRLRRRPTPLRTPRPRPRKPKLRLTHQTLFMEKPPHPSTALTPLVRQHSSPSLRIQNSAIPSSVTSPRPARLPSSTAQPDVLDTGYTPRLPRAALPSDT